MVVPSCDQHTKTSVEQFDAALERLAVARQGAADYTAIEALSELRLLAVAMGDYHHPGISAEQARNFLTQVTALNLDLL